MVTKLYTRNWYKMKSGEEILYFSNLKKITRFLGQSTSKIKKNIRNHDIVVFNGKNYKIYRLTPFVSQVSLSSSSGFLQIS